MLAREVLRMHGTISREHPWGVLPDLCFYRGPEEIEKEERAAAEKAVTKEEFQGGWTGSRAHRHSAQGGRPVRGRAGAFPGFSSSPRKTGVLSLPLKAGLQRPPLRPRNGRNHPVVVVSCSSTDFHQSGK